MQLSEHFMLSEFLVSQTAARRGIDNAPSPEVIGKLQALCENVMEPVREHFMRPVVISSGYRSPALNRAIGGAGSSQHCKGEAADFEIPGISNLDVAIWMQAALNYDQLILEFHTPGDPGSGWVHVSWRPDYRNMELTARRVRKWGRWTSEYVPGLVE